ncbi:MAG: hypothetical protein J5I94_23630 [Phaeodactylibacter sp.]|nr:hypothetical protein [Phaeodactylibacter sp.]
MRVKVFVDTNIIVDFLTERQPFDVPAAQPNGRWPFLTEPNIFLPVT